MDTWSKELWVEGTFLERRFLKADLKQVHHHGGQRGDHYRRNLQDMQTQQELTFKQIYKVETSQINNNFVMTAACDDILDREKLAVNLQGKQAYHQITQIDSGGDEIDTTSNNNRLLPQ